MEQTAGAQESHVCWAVYVDSIDTEEEFLSLALIPEAWGFPSVWPLPREDVNPNGFSHKLQ